MTIACPNCGTPNSDDHRFCSNCGARIALPAESNGASSTAQQDYPSRYDAVLNPSSFVVKRSEPVSGESVPANEQVPAPTIPIAPQADAAPYPGSSYSPAARPAGPGPAQGQPGYTPPGGYGPPPGGVQAYAPGSQKKEGFTYVPYAGASSVTTTRDQKSWLVPVIIGAAVVLLGLVLLSGYLVVSNRGNSQGSPGAVSTPGANTGAGDAGQTPFTSKPGQAAGNGMAGPSPTPLGESASEEDRIRQAIYRSNENQIQSWKDLNEEILRKSYTGDALDENIKQVQELKQRNMYAVPVNESLKILDVKADGNAAIAHTLEVWTVTYYGQADNKPITRNQFTLSETYHLVKQDGTWFIDKLDITETGTPTPGGSGGGGA